MKEAKVLVTVRVPDDTDDIDVAYAVGERLDEALAAFHLMASGQLEPLGITVPGPWEVTGSVLAVRSGELPAALRTLARDARVVQAAHVALEDALVQARDAGVRATGPRGHARNGLSVCEKDGSPSPVIRIGTAAAVAMTLREIASYLTDPPATARRIEEIRREMRVE